MHPFRMQYESMATTFTIKQIPDALADALRERAASNRRSLQGELLLILESSVGAPTRHIAEPPAPAYAPATPKRAASRTPARRNGKLTLDEVWQRARKLGGATPSESTDLIRRDRDARHGR